MNSERFGFLKALTKWWGSVLVSHMCAQVAGSSGSGSGCGQQLSIATCPVACISVVLKGKILQALLLGQAVMLLGVGEAEGDRWSKFCQLHIALYKGSHSLPIKEPLDAGLVPKTVTAAP